MPLPRRGLYWAEVAVSLLSACLFVVTLVDPQWIEFWLDASPDVGDGSAERWLVGGGFLLATILAAALARRERRLQVPPHGARS